MCEICKLRMEVDRLREEDEAKTMAEAQAGGTRCFIHMANSITNKNTITIYGGIDPYRLQLLLDLLVEIDAQKMVPSSSG